MPSLNDLLVYAASAGNYKLVRERVEAGADVNHVEPNKGSALFAGIRSPQCIAYLLARGADPNFFVAGDGQTALDHALSMVSYHTAQSAHLLHRFGARANIYSILEPPSPDTVVTGRILIGRGNWFCRFALGQICFGWVGHYEADWVFDCDFGTKEGHLFRIEAMYLPDRLNIHCVEKGEEGFTLVDFRGRAHPCPGNGEQIQLDAAISFCR